MTEKQKTKFAAVSLLLASFFLPFGYDALFALIMKLTGSFWITDGIFYFISACFFGLYFFFSGYNPILEVRDVIQSIYEDKIKHYSRKKRG